MVIRSTTKGTAALTAAPLSSTRIVAIVTLLAASTFIFITVENMPIGLLPLMADAYDVAPSMIGLLVTGYAVIVALASVPLAKMGSGFQRRVLLCSAIAVLIVASLVTALSPNYNLLLLSRIVGALAHAMFWSVVATTAVSLVDRSKQGIVVSIIFAGNSLGTVLGIPFMTWIANQEGWRFAFFVMSCLGLGVFALIAVLLPKDAPACAVVSTGSSPDKRKFRHILVTATVGVSGIFIAQTYVALFLTEVLRLDSSQLSWALFAAGGMGFVGVFVGGLLAPRKSELAIAGPLGLISLSMLCAYVSASNLLVVIVMFALVAFGFSAFGAAVQIRVLTVAPGSTDLASAKSSAVFNIGIASGSLIGAAVVEVFAVRSTVLVTSALTALALIIFLLGRRPDALPRAVISEDTSVPNPPGTVRSQKTSDHD